MKYQDPSFSIGVGSEAYKSGWERIFGKNKKSQKEKTCPTCNGEGNLLDSEGFIEGLCPDCNL